MFLNLKKKRTTYSTENRFVYDREEKKKIIFLSTSFENTYKLQKQDLNSMHPGHQFYVLSNPVKLFTNFQLHCNIYKTGSKETGSKDACDRTASLLPIL